MAGTTLAYPRSGFVLSAAELRRAYARGPLERFLRFYAKRDVVLLFDDFMTKALDATNLYTVATGATATAFAPSQTLEDGVLRGVSGTTAATSGLQFQIPVTGFTGSKNAGCEVRWQTSVVTETRIEMGFVNALPAVNTSIVNNLTTPTYNTTATAALYLFDNASSTNTGGLYMIGSAVSATKSATTTTYPTAATYQTVRIQVNGTKVSMWVDGILVAQPTADGLTAADALKFVFSHKKNDTTTSNVDIDYIAVWKDRNN